MGRNVGFGAKVGRTVVVREFRLLCLSHDLAPTDVMAIFADMIIQRGMPEFIGSDNARRWWP